METPGRIAELERKFGENPRRYFAALANEYRKNGEIERAIELCESHLSEQRNHLSGHVVLAQALVDAGRDEAAWGPLHTALDLDPENFIALRLLGELSARAGDPAQARAYFFRALEIEPRNEQLLESLKALSPRVELPPPTPPASRPEGFEATSLGTAAEPEVRDAEAELPEADQARPDAESEPPEADQARPDAEPEPAEAGPHIAGADAAAPEPEPLILLETVDDLPEIALPEIAPAAEQEETLPLSVAAEEAAEPQPTPVDTWPEWEPDAPTGPEAEREPVPDQAEPAFTVDLVEATEWWAGEPPAAAVQENEAGAVEADSATPEHDAAAMDADSGAPQEDEAAADADQESESRPTLVSETMVGLYLSQGHTALAIAALRDLVATRPDDERLRARLKELEDATPRERQETVRDMFARLGRPRSRPRETASALAGAFAAGSDESAVARFFGDSAPPAGEPADAALSAALAPVDATSDAAAFERWLAELRTS